MTLTASNSGRQLYCVVTDAYGNTAQTNTVSMSVAAQPAPLAVTADLADFTGSVGDTASFTVQAEGDGLSYQWWVKSRTATKFSKSSVVSATYSVTLTAARNGNQLYCVVTDAYGNTAQTNTVTMTVSASQTPLAVTADLADFTGSVGDTASFTVLAQGDGLSYQWWVKSRTATKFSKSSVVSAAYSVTLTASNSGRQLYCVVTDAYGNTAQTNTVSMTVAAQPAPLAVAADLADFTGSVGDTAVFTVGVTGGTEPYAYAWYVKAPGISAFALSDAAGANCSLTLAAADDGTQVYCIVTDAAGCSVQTGTASVTVETGITPLTIVTQPEDYTGVKYSTATFTVEAEGEGLRYQWYYKHRSSSVFIPKSGATSAACSAEIDGNSNGTQFYCVVTDAYGNTARTNTVTLILSPTALSILTQPVDYVGSENSTASFGIFADGDGLSFQWYQKSPSASVFSRTDVTTRNYSVRLTSYNTGTQFYCVVTDAYGNTIQSNIVSMTITPLILVSQPNNYIGSLGSTALFTVEATGEGLHYQWWVKNRTATRFTKSSVTTATYSAELTSSSTGRQLYCVVTDAYGNTVQTDTVTMTIG